MGENVRWYYPRENDTQEIRRHDNHGLGTREGGLGKGNGPTPLIGSHFFWGGVCFDSAPFVLMFLCHVNRLDGAANQFRPG